MNNESNNKPSEEGPYLYVKDGAIHLGISRGSAQEANQCFEAAR